MCIERRERIRWNAIGSGWVWLKTCIYPEKEEKRMVEWGGVEWK
jgi:hypothetical protein